MKRDDKFPRAGNSRCTALERARCFLGTKRRHRGVSGSRGREGIDQVVMVRDLGLSSRALGNY